MAVTYAPISAVCNSIRTYSGLLLTVAVLSATASCSNDDGAGSDAAPRMQVVFDYSPTLSDAGALLYLASHPAVELLAVTLPGTGEADCEPGVRATRSLLTVVGYGNVPIGCGRNTPLIGDRDWPEEWLKEVSRWAENELLPPVDAEPVIDAEQLLADTLDAATSPITLIAVGPLTNLGAVLGDRPELADKVERVVVMGGAVTVPGNVEASPAAEWNIYIDPEAGRRVIAADVEVTFVPLDATNFVPWTERLLARIGALGTSASEILHQLANSRDTIDGIYLWDELAAMVAVVPSLATVEEMTVRIDDDGAVVRDPTGVRVAVAIGADAGAAIEEFLGTLNGGAAPAAVSLTADELEYFVQVGGADSRFNIVISGAFGDIDESNPDLRGMASSLISDFVAAADALLIELRAMDPPASLHAPHSEFVESLAAFVASRDELLAAVAVAEGADLGELLDNVLVDAGVDEIFERVNSACQALVDYSFLRDGPRPCTAGG